MKSNMHQAIAAIILTGIFSSAQAANVSLTSADFPFNLGTEPTAANTYSVSHSPGSFNDMYSFSLSTLSDTVSSAVSLFLPGLGGGGPSYNITGGTLSLFSDPSGLGGPHTLVSSVAFGSTNSVLAVSHVTAGQYFWDVSGTASGSLGGVYMFSANTAPVPEPGTYAMILAGLGLLGFIAKRRSGLMPSAGLPLGMA